MENAADALKIAGELLIGLLLISLFIFVFQRMSSLEEEKSQQELIEQTTKFNEKFTAFDKTSMYGTDLISILGLAYANNKSANLSKKLSHADEIDGYYDPDLGESINIKFKLKEDIVKKVTTEKYKIEDGENKLQGTPEVEEKGIIFKKDTWYSLAQKKDDGSDNMEVVTSIKNIVIDGNTTDVQTKKSGITTTIITTDASGFNEFKKNIFKCTKIDYGDTGRIYSMTFEQK